MEERVSSFVGMLREICERQQIGLRSFSGNWCHRLERDGKTALIVGYQFGLNTASAREICRDKALTWILLSDQGVPAAEHRFLTLGQHYSEEMETEYLRECEKLLQRDGVLVLKDNYGTGGNRVYRIESIEEARETLRMIQGFSYAAALSPYYPIDAEYRVVVLDQEPLLTIRKERATHLENGVEVLSDWRHNLGQGARGIPETDEKLLQKLHALAVRALRAVPARFESVDIIRVGSDLLVLEINGGVMLEHFSSQDPQCRRLALSVYEQAVLKMLA